MKKIDLGIINSGVPTDFYSENPCTIGYSFIRFELGSIIKPCCVVKNKFKLDTAQDWRQVWHSQAYDIFRKKLLNISEKKFHLTDPEWLSCQNCAHMNINKPNAEKIKSE